MSNLCEDKLGPAFAPDLFVWNGDYLGREPHWVVRPLLASVQRVRLMYLLSYYRDEGSSTFACSLPFAHSSCHGHTGDSEFIALDVGYNAETRQWVLEAAHYSAHENVRNFTAGPNGYPASLYYPVKAGGYPRAWVSQGKHANYESLAACNSGGAFNTDTCELNNSRVRLVADPTLNIGSRVVNTGTTKDCMVSANASYQWYGAGRVECYWTFKAFRGWIPDTIGGASSDAYSGRLSQMGF